MANDELVTLEQVQAAFEKWRKAYNSLQELGAELGRQAEIEAKVGAESKYSKATAWTHSLEITKLSTQQAWGYYENLQARWASQERQKNENAMLKLADSQKRSAWWVAAATVAIFLATAVQLGIQFRPTAPTRVTCTWPSVQGAPK
jgi:hypothetical protein